MPPQDGARESIPILFLSSWNLCRGSGFVSASANWSSEETWATRRAPDWTWSLIKWKSMATCFILEWKTGFEQSWVAPTLSHSKSGVSCKLIPSSSRRDWIQAMSEAAVASARYSASIEEWAIDKVIAQKNDISRSWLSIIKITTPIRIREAPEYWICLATQ